MTFDLLQGSSLLWIPLKHAVDQADVRRREKRTDELDMNPLVGKNVWKIRFLVVTRPQRDMWASLTLVTMETE